MIDQIYFDPRSNQYHQKLINSFMQKDITGEAD